MMDKDKLYEYLLILGDNSRVLGHRLSELCGHGPSLETDIACTNISLDLFGQVRSYFQYAAQVKGGGATEDTIAYFRSERQFRNAVLLEQQNKDFGYVICRQFLFDSFHLPLLHQLMNSSDEQIAAIAAKSIKESKYHLTFSSQWMRRLGDGTEESNRRIQAALNDLYPYAKELVTPVPLESWAHSEGIGADLLLVEESMNDSIQKVINEAHLTLPDSKPRYAQGKSGIHTEQLGYILAEFQSTQRAYPNLAW